VKILFNDIIQYSDAPDSLKTAALADYYAFTPNGNGYREAVINLDKEYKIDAIGLGNTNGINFNIKFDDTIELDFLFDGNGLYTLDKPVTASKIIISTDATYLGRFGAGIGCDLPTAVAKEPSYKSTSEPRKTLSGQVVIGAGGYEYRTISLDVKYKVTQEIINEFEAGKKYIGKGYPFFIDLTVESYKLSYKRLYADERQQRSVTWQSGILKFLYSRRFEFEECF